MKDWPTLERAVDQKIEDQREFVQWWSESVRGLGNPAKKSTKLMSAERGALTMPDAETYRYHAPASQQVGKTSTGREQV